MSATTGCKKKNRKKSSDVLAYGHRGCSFQRYEADAHDRKPCALRA
jgi:hypothetical protein